MNVEHLYGVVKCEHVSRVIHSLAQLRVRDTKKQKQRGHDDARMTESRNTRNEQLTDKELLPGKHLNGSECSKARLIL